MKHPHAALIDALGGGTAIADWINDRLPAGHKAIDRESVYAWKRNGVAWPWRSLVAAMAADRHVCLPDGFVPNAPAAPLVADKA